MLLARTTREMYLTAKHNLICGPKALKPKGLLEMICPELDEQTRRGCISIRQLSLLRVQMKADLGIYGYPFVKELAEHERAFLHHCRARRWRQPWIGTLLRPRRGENCADGYSGQLVD
jgi:hypothetical protein